MPAHTPGPWKAHNQMPYFYTIRDAANRYLCEVGAIDAGTTPDMEANARLIAAAPRMLRQIANMVSIARQYEAGIMSAQDTADSIRYELDENRAILRDVEGESNG